MYYLVDNSFQFCQQLIFAVDALDDLTGPLHQLCGGQSGTVPGCQSSLWIRDQQVLQVREQRIALLYLKCSGRQEQLMSRYI